MARVQEAPKPEEVPTPTQGLNAKIDGLRVTTWIWIGVVIAVVVLGFGAWWTYVLDRDTVRMDLAGGGMGAGMAGMAPADAPRFPAVAGFYEDKEILFIHTEASDADVASMLTDMMASPVITVPELADVPDSALADVYVFTNGVKPEDAQGPLGFQPDVFDSAPGEDDYSPLRSVLLVTWEEGTEPRLLKSSAEIERAVEQGEISVEEPGAVVNIPFLTWPDGRR